MNKKTLKSATVAFAAAALCVSTMASCSNSKKSEDTAAVVDTAVVEVVEEQPGKTVMPYSAEFFNNEANRANSTSPADSTWVQTPSGLKYAVIKEGTGKMPLASDVVTVNYAGQLTDLEATEFDSSYARKQPAQFPLSGVIKGWTEGLQLMKEGAVYEFYIPADLAYGERGDGGRGVIPPNAPLIFQVELISVDGSAQ